MTDKEVIISTPAALVAWTGYHRPEIDMEEKAAVVLLGYMEGHGYTLAVKGAEMFRKDVEDGREETVPYSIDEVIDIVCEWNYELLEDAGKGMENPDNFLDFCRHKELYDSLNEDVLVLDALYAQTIYGKKPQSASEREKGITAQAGSMAVDKKSYSYENKCSDKNGGRLR